MSTGKKRVVVTGLGAVTPIGNTVAEFWTSIRNSVSGIGTITRFDPARLDCRVAAQLKNFDVAQHIDFKEARRMALFTQYAVAAAKMAWVDSGLDKGGSDPERVAVVLGNGIGGAEVLDEGYKTVSERGPGRLSAAAEELGCPKQRPGLSLARRDQRGTAGPDQVKRGGPVSHDDAGRPASRQFFCRGEPRRRPEKGGSRVDPVALRR